MGEREKLQAAVWVRFDRFSLKKTQMLIVKVRRVGCPQALEAQVVELEHLLWELPTLAPGMYYSTANLELRIW